MSRRIRELEGEVDRLKNRPLWKRILECLKPKAKSSPYNRKRKFCEFMEKIFNTISSSIYNYCICSSLLVHEMVNAPVRLNYRLMEGIDDMRFINARYNSSYNSIDITTFDNILLRIDCNKAEEGIRTTPGSQCAPMHWQLMNRWNMLG